MVGVVDDSVPREQCAADGGAFSVASVSPTAVRFQWRVRRGRCVADAVAGAVTSTAVSAAAALPLYCCGYCCGYRHWYCRGAAARAVQVLLQVQPRYCRGFAAGRVVVNPMCLPPAQRRGHRYGCCHKRCRKCRRSVAANVVAVWFRTAHAKRTEPLHTTRDKGPRVVAEHVSSHAANCPARCLPTALARSRAHLWLALAHLTPAVQVNSKSKQTRKRRPAGDLCYT